jgi:molybdate transport system substrate-binding protein
MNAVSAHRLLIASLVVCLFASCRPALQKGAENQATATRLSPATLTISVAASAKDVFEKIVAEYHRHSEDRIRINSGASNALANQIQNGAPVDLFLSASPKWSSEVETAGLARKSSKLLTNRLAIVVPRGNPGAVRSPNDLLKPTVRKIALAGESVPAGQYAEQALRKLNLMESLLTGNKVVRGQDVRTALSYVEQGEAEVGIVYSTDAAISDQVSLVHEFDPQLHDEIVYVLVTLKQKEAIEPLDKFVAFIESPEAEQIFLQFGFHRISAAPAENSQVKQ